MTANGHQLVRLEFTSAFEMLDFVQVVSDHLARGVGLDEDSLHWVSVAIRESVINAIKHGNRSDTAKHVFVEFETATNAEVPELAIRVRDQGEGFDPNRSPTRSTREPPSNPAAAAFFLIRNFMDDVQLRRAQGGMEIWMVKKVQPADGSEPA
jgi:serine/threonine-protein kinase RsbW